MSARAVAASRARYRTEYRRAFDNAEHARSFNSGSERQQGHRWSAVTDEGWAECASQQAESGARKVAFDLASYVVQQEVCTGSWRSGRITSLRALSADAEEAHRGAREGKSATGAGGEARRLGRVGERAGYGRRARGCSWSRSATRRLALFTSSIRSGLCFPRGC